MSAAIIPLFRPLILEGSDPWTIPKPPTNARSFSFHISADACHSIVFGRTGSGKTAMTAALLAQLQRQRKETT
jgi:hypothetical protein